MKGASKSETTGGGCRVATGDKGSPRWVLVCACVGAFVPATRAGLCPQGFVCTAARKWTDWAPGAATGQTGHMSPAEGASTLYIFTYTYILIR